MEHRPAVSRYTRHRPLVETRAGSHGVSTAGELAAALVVASLLGCAATRGPSVGSLPAQATDAAVPRGATDETSQLRDFARIQSPADLLKASKVPELPEPLASLEFGMSAAEARRAAPHLDGGGRFLAWYGGAYFSYYVPDATDRLKSAGLQIEGADMAELLTEAWGEPARGMDRGQPHFIWFNEAKRLRAKVTQAGGKGDEVSFDAYLPVEELLGVGKETLGFESPSRPLLGATREEVGRHYAEFLETLTKEEAAARRKELEEFTGEDLSALGPPARTTNIDLLPTDCGSQFTRVHPKFTDDGKVERLRVGISWSFCPSAKEEFLALIVAKWGEPRERTWHGRKVLVFNDDPLVVVEDDTSGMKWDIEVEVPGRRTMPDSARLARAQARLLKVLEEHPDDPDALEQLADVYLELGQFDEARAKAERCVAVSPRSAVCWLMIAVIADERGSKKRAAEGYRRYLELAPEGRYAGSVRKALGRLGEPVPARGDIDR